MRVDGNASVELGVERNVATEANDLEGTKGNLENTTDEDPASNSRRRTEKPIT